GGHDGEEDPEGAGGGLAGGDEVGGIEDPEVGALAGLGGVGLAQHGADLGHGGGDGVAGEGLDADDGVGVGPLPDDVLDHGRDRGVEDVVLVEGAAGSRCSCSPTISKKTLLTEIVCPTGSTSLGKRWSTTVVPITATLAWLALSASVSHRPRWTWTLRISPQAGCTPEKFDSEYVAPLHVTV